MSFGNIIGGLLRQGLSSQSHNRLQNGARSAEQGGGLEQMLGALLRKQNRSAPPGGGGGLADIVGGFLGNRSAGGMSGAKIGGLGAAAGALTGGGMRGAAKGGAMAVLGALALKAWREHQAQAQGAPQSTEPTAEEADALTHADTEQLVLRAMIGAAQVDGHVDESEMNKILAHMHEDEITEDERRAAREEVNRPVDVEALGAKVSRPEVATEIYLAALLAVDIDSDAERDYFRRLARALRLEPDVIDRLHRMTGAPRVA